MALIFLNSFCCNSSLDLLIYELFMFLDVLIAAILILKRDSSLTAMAMALLRVSLGQIWELSL